MSSKQKIVRIDALLNEYEKLKQSYEELKELNAYEKLKELYRELKGLHNKGNVYVKILINNDNNIIHIDTLSDLEVSMQHKSEEISKHLDIILRSNK